jgi:hypothetical protein
MPPIVLITYLLALFLFFVFFAAIDAIYRRRNRRDSASFEEAAKILGFSVISDQNEIKRLREELLRFYFPNDFEVKLDEAAISVGTSKIFLLRFHYTIFSGSGGLSFYYAGVLTSDLDKSLPKFALDYYDDKSTKKLNELMIRLTGGRAGIKGALPISGLDETYYLKAADAQVARDYLKQKVIPYLAQAEVQKVYPMVESTGQRLLYFIPLDDAKTMDSCRVLLKQFGEIMERV